MSWTVQAQMSVPNPEMNLDSLEWNAVVVDTQEEAEAWWNCRTQVRAAARRVHTMWNPEGEVVRVSFQ